MAIHHITCRGECIFAKYDKKIDIFMLIFIIESVFLLSSRPIGGISLITEI